MKTIRLKNYDYSSNGMYFITICSEKKRCIFGNIVGQGLCSCQLSETGKIIKEEIESLSQRYSEIKIENFIIMPNHVHILLTLERQEQSPCPTISEAICSFKSITTKRANLQDNVKGRKIWQRSFYDHIVRNQTDYEQIWQYIEYNVAKWNEDKYFI